MNTLSLPALFRRNSAPRGVRILHTLRVEAESPTIFRQALRAVRPALTAENANLAVAFVALLVLFASLPERNATAITVCSGVILAAIFIGIPATEQKGGEK